MSTKKAIKSIKAKIEAKEYEAANYEATELLKSLKDNDTESAQVLTFRGLAQLQLERKDEAEKCYLHAYRLQPSFELPAKALRKLYEKEKQWDKLGRFLETVVQQAHDENDGEKCAAALQDLVEARTHQGTESLYLALQLLLPSSPLVPLLQPVPAPAGTFVPFPEPVYPPASLAVLPSLPKTLPHVLHLVGSYGLLLNYLIRQQGLVHQEIEAKVKAGRTRLGGGTEKDVRKRVEREVLGGELGLYMVELLREVGNHPNVDEVVRREVELQEFQFWRKLVGALAIPSKASAKAPAAKAPAPKPGGMMISSGKAKPPVQKPAPDTSGLPSAPLFAQTPRKSPTQEEALARADDLANGFVLLGVVSAGAEEAWSWVIEGKNEPTLYYDLELLHKYAKAFPESKFTSFIDDYCRWFKLPLPEPEEETGDDKEKAPAPKNEGKAQRYWRQRKEKKAANNARERRKARRLAGKEGVLSEDLDREERDELVSAMTKLADGLPKSIFVQRVMARVAIQEEEWANAIAFAEKGRKLVKEVEGERGISLAAVYSSLDTALGVALVPYFPPKHHTRATRLLNGVIKENEADAEARSAKAQILATAGEWAEARSHYQTILDLGGSDREMVAAREEVAWCLVNESKLDEGREILESVVEMRDTQWEESGKEDEALPRARAWWRLGRTEWMIGDAESKQHAEDWFMASARALATYAPAYSSLGFCYLEASPPDTDRAHKCFQKAFELDATEAEAARLLAEMYANDDEWALVRAIANRVMEGEGGVEGVAGGEVMNAKGRFAPKNGWAWKALGSTEMHYRNYAKAGQSYQIALRADPDDVSTWVQLGVSYVKCGRHQAGLKTLGHALELDPTNWMAMYHIGDIHLQLGAYETAIASLEDIIKTTGETHVGIIAKMAEAKLALGRQNAAGGFRERSRNAFYGAITLAADVLRLGQGHRPWAWKIVGDAAFELSTQESELQHAGASSEVVVPVLQLLVEDDTDRRATVQDLGHAANLLQSPVDLNFSLHASVYAFAYRAYLLKNEPRVHDPALYDLASALHALGPRLEAEKKTACLKAAVGAIRLALERDAGDERLWNALGVMCAEGGEELAQHAFVVSLELYGKDPVVWTNLGYLYLKLDDRELAGQCFLKAQTLDPDDARAWLGQGLLADRNGDKEHARALFAHAVTLSAGALLEADLAQAIATFLPLVNTATDPSLLHGPAFALRHYVHQRPTDASALHLYALICERLGLVDEAATSLEAAAALLEEAFESAESTAIERAYSIALVNLGRVRLAAGKYSEALDAFTNAWELVSSSPESDQVLLRLKIQSRLGQALAHFWLEDVDKSLEAFQQSLDEAEGGGEKGGKAEVAVLLARTLWGLGGEDAKEAAKTNLMECLSEDTPPIKVINTLAAVALVSSDPDLLDAALSELRALSPERTLAEDPANNVSLLLSTHALALDNQADAVSALESAVQISPGDTKTRNRLAQILISSGRGADAVSLLGMAGSRDVGVQSETMKLRGVARVLEGDEGGMSDLLAAVRICPWDEKALEGMAWAKKALAEVEDDEADEAVAAEKTEEES